MPRLPYLELLEHLNETDERRPRRREHHLAADEYRRTDVAFFVTLCARRHGQSFHDPVLAGKVVEALLYPRKHGVWSVYAYCLMPDHLHAVVQLGRQDGELAAKGILERLAEFKSYTTREAWKVGLRGRLWQHDQHDRLVRNDTEFEACCLYLLNNPVRKGWVEDWTLWPYASTPDTENL